MHTLVAIKETTIGYAVMAQKKMVHRVLEICTQNTTTNRGMLTNSARRVKQTQKINYLPPGDWPHQTQWADMTCRWHACNEVGGHLDTSTTYNTERDVEARVPNPNSTGRVVALEPSAPTVECENKQHTDATLHPGDGMRTAQKPDHIRRQPT